MKAACALAATVVLLLAQYSRAEVPHGFSWVNLESDTTTMTAVRRALHDSSITAIREVGLEEGFALVMTSSRESGAPTPEYDRWSVYNISLATGESNTLVSGYGLQIIDWIGRANHELAITYYHCWECEPETLFTTLHFDEEKGWRARWTNKSTDENYPQPGAAVMFTDVDDSDDVVAQIYAVVEEPNDSFAVGSWTHSRNARTGVVDNDVEKYSFDPTSGKERIEKLTGRAALTWEREICTQKNILIKPSSGQDSKACKSVLRRPTSPLSTSKKIDRAFSP